MRVPVQIFDEPKLSPIRAPEQRATTLSTTGPLSPFAIVPSQSEGLRKLSERAQPEVGEGEKVASRAAVEKGRTRLG